MISADEFGQESRKQNCRVCGRSYLAMRGIDEPPSCPYCGGHGRIEGIEELKPTGGQQWPKLQQVAG
jgi:hypothetical protein